MDIKTIPISQIKTAAYNPRKDLQPGDPEYEGIKRSIQEYGMIEPLIWNQQTGNLVGGHQRLKILIANGATDAAVSIVDLDAMKEKALNLALNQVQGGWDEERLIATIEELVLAGQDLGPTGFTEKDLDKLLGQYEAIDLDEREEAQAGQGEGTQHTCPKCGFEY